MSHSILFILALALNPASADWSYKRVTDPSSVERLGNHFTFTLFPDTPRLSHGARQELTHPDRLKNQGAVEYTMVTQFPNYEVGHPRSLVVMQWHESMPPGEAHRRPPLAHRWRQGFLEVTLWNDAIFAAQGLGGDGKRLARLPVHADRWYQFRYRLVFDPEQGEVLGFYRECQSPQSCEGAWTKFVEHRGGLGYAQAVDYYFKFGVYTTQSFTRAVQVKHFMSVADLQTGLLAWNQ